MAHSFHPHPIVAVTKVVMMTVLLSILVLVMRELLERILYPLMASLWLVGIVFILVAYLASRFQTLTLEENSMLFQSGILATRRIMLPYSKITETSYVQGLVQRVFGVGTLNVDTAGGGNMAIHMPDVKHDDLKRILAEIRAKGGKGDGT
ncbi:PH domain-containing protein [Candidatus Micrarchaeota archaeon]|nr:PH domain-containing protein [Candidatus Micrarchaeota archaeon]